MKSTSVITPAATKEVAPPSAAATTKVAPPPSAAVKKQAAPAPTVAAAPEHSYDIVNTPSVVKSMAERADGTTTAVQIGAKPERGGLAIFARSVLSVVTGQPAKLVASDAVPVPGNYRVYFNGKNTGVDINISERK